jgi:hypothetical protein
MPMRVPLRVAEFFGDSLFEALRNKMLEALGFIMNLIDRVVENFVKKSLDQRWS